jgi:exopolysaccharide biosynthesis polyprenyl glycosylphosphotransferase
MIISNKKEQFFLLVGDLFIFALSLWISLALRGGDSNLFNTYRDHLVPFSIIFAAWILVFFIAGLYDRYRSLLKDKMPGMIFNALLINCAIAVVFFYLIPYFGIAPKTVLFLNLVITFGLVYFWRIYIHSVSSLKRKENAILIGSGDELKELEKEFNNNSKLGLKFVSTINLDDKNSVDAAEIVKKIKTEDISVVVIDFKDNRVEPVFSHLYNMIFLGIRFVDIDEIYEDVFDRVPLSLLEYTWFLENISLTQNPFYYSLKRAFDILVSLILGVIFCILFPFVYIAIKIEDGGPIFFVNKMVGKNNRLINIIKFRSMSVKVKEKITKVGEFLRKTRIDEFPQFWNVLSGDLSLIGPRPEKQDLVALYEKEIPYYAIRYLIKPGLSGWAQIWQENPPKYGVDFNNTRVKLSYDLYYVKNRSLMLDLNIALKTIKDLLSRRGK